jgi:hypothetical protein
MKRRNTEVQPQLAKRRASRSKILGVRATYSLGGGRFLRIASKEKATGLLEVMTVSQMQ